MARHGETTQQGARGRRAEEQQREAFAGQGEYGSGGSYGVGGGFEDPLDGRPQPGRDNDLPRQQGWELGPERDSVRGPYYGVAPRGYSRSDERIREDVCELLMSWGHVDPSRVTVQVEKGVVILDGEVDSRRDKHAIESKIEHVLSVQDIDNRLRITRAS